MAGKTDILKRLLMMGDEQAVKEAEERAFNEVGEDILRSSPSMHQMNEEFASDAARQAKEQDLKAAFGQPNTVQNRSLIGESAEPKSAADSFSAFNEAKPQDFVLVGEPYTPKEYPIVPRVSTIPGVIEGQATRVMPEMTSTSGRTKTQDLLDFLNRNKGKAALAAGAGGAGGLALMGGDDLAQASKGTSTPVAAAAPAPETKTPAQAPAAPVGEKPQGPAIKTPGLATEKPESNVIDIGKNVGRDAEAEAREQARSARQAGLFGKAGETIGTAISRAKPVGSQGFDDAIKLSDKNVEDAKANDNEKKDPKSPTSKAFKAFLAQVGINVKGDFTAEMGEKLMPIAFKKFEAEENRKSRESLARERIEATKVTASARAEDKSERESVRKDEKNFAHTQKLRQELDKQTKDAQDAFDQRRQLADLIGDSLKSGAVGKGFQDLALNYGVVKTLDPDSAVREGELKLQASIGSVPDRLRRSFNAAMRGITYDKKDLEELNRMIQRQLNASVETYKQRSQSVLKQAETAGLDPSQINSRPDIMDYGKKRAPASTNPVVKKGYNAKTNQTQLIYADGTKEIKDGRH